MRQKTGVIKEHDHIEIYKDGEIPRERKKTFNSDLHEDHDDDKDLD